MSPEMIDIMLPAFAACLVLVGIHSYLGIHVIQRKVIFVDLALAQIAALGSTFAFLFGIDPSSIGAYWFSLGFTIIGAAIFSLSRIRHEKIPQEAVIGLVYALAAAAAILVIDRAPHGAEHIKEIMTGNILWVQWDTIIKAAIVYSLVGIFHFIYRHNFIMISVNPDLAYSQGLNIRLWDFLFYASFGIVITHSVGTAGVLLVFVFLVVPAIATIMITDKLWLQLILGWGMGTLVSVLGLLTSYVADFPSGPTVVVTYGLVLLVTTLGLYVIRAKRKVLALKNLSLGIAVFLLIVGGFWMMGKGFQRGAIQIHEETESLDLHARMHDRDSIGYAAISNQQLEILLTETTHTDSLLTIYNRIENPFQRFEIAHRIFDLDEKQGSLKLIDFLDFCQIPFLRQKALDILVSRSSNNFGYDALKSHAANQEALNRWQEWWKETYPNR